MYSCLICGIKSEAEYVITHHRCTYADMKKLHEDQNRKRDRMTWTPEQQERVLQLIDYCTEMTSGYLSGWAKSLMADLKPPILQAPIPEGESTWCDVCCKWIPTDEYAREHMAYFDPERTITFNGHERMRCSLIHSDKECATIEKAKQEECQSQIGKLKETIRILRSNAGYDADHIRELNDRDGKYI